MKPKLKKKNSRKLVIQKGKRESERERERERENCKISQQK